MIKNKGFTLIELLVVIAIIGILASVVLASLSGARIKAKVAAAQSTLSSMRAQAEIGMVNGKYIENICKSSVSQGGFGALLDSLNKTSSKVVSIKCGVDATLDTDLARRWVVEVLINNKYYCADSTGYSGFSGSTGTSSTISTVPVQTVPVSGGVLTSINQADTVCSS